MLRASSSLRFWLGIRTKHNSNCACSSGSLSIIGSGFVMKFMIHSGLCFSETPAHPGPTRRSSVYLWQLAHFKSEIVLPSFASATSNLSPTSTASNFPSPRCGSYALGSDVADFSSGKERLFCWSLFVFDVQAYSNMPIMPSVINFFIVLLLVYPVHMSLFVMFYKSTVGWVVHFM